MVLGIAGCGLIVDTALDALQSVPEIKVAAVYARQTSREKAQGLLDKYHLTNQAVVTTDYDEMIKDACIDCIYIGLTNTVHYLFAKKALEAGKHVILEKPSVMEAEHLEELIGCASQQQVFLFEAFTTWHSLIFQKMQELLPQIGRVRLATASYAQYSSRYDAYLRGQVLPAFDPALGGGCLNDIMVYNISLMAGMFGTPDEVTYAANLGFNGVDTSGILHLRYADFVASASAAKDCSGPGYFTVSGERGYFRANGAPNFLQSIDYCIDGQSGSYEPDQGRHRMVREFREMAQTIKDRDEEAANRWLDCSRATLAMTCAAAKDAGLIRCTDMME